MFWEEGRCTKVHGTVLGLHGPQSEANVQASSPCPTPASQHPRSLQTAGWWCPAALPGAHLGQVTWSFP